MNEQKHDDACGASRSDAGLDIGYPKLGDTKTVFAWWPIARMVRMQNCFMRDGCYWMRRVVVMRTFLGWAAYADRNG